MRYITCKRPLATNKTITKYLKLRKLFLKRYLKLRLCSVMLRKLFPTRKTVIDTGSFTNYVDNRAS